jgi:hypothetical protein
MARGIFAEYVWEYFSYEMCAHSDAYGINCATGRRSILSAGRAINYSARGIFPPLSRARLTDVLFRVCRMAFRVCRNCPLLPKGIREHNGAHAAVAGADRLFPRSRADRHDERHAAVAEPHVRDLHGHRRAVQHDDFMAPIELVGLAWSKSEGYIGLRQCRTALLAPTYRIALLF